MTLRIGSLFTGTGALDLAVMDVYDADVVWHSQYEPPDKKGKEDTNQYAAKILARHWPTVPNLGDITKVDWQAVVEEHGPIDVLTGGFPCQDISSAGRRVGLNPDSRSGLWTHMARAVAVLQPRLVIIENVEGLLSAPAASDLEHCPYCMGDRHTQPLLRACGAVLGDLATLGFDAEWVRVGADEVGAPHRRRRIIIRAWPAALDSSGIGRGDGPRILGGLGAAGRSTEAVQDADIQPGDERRIPAPGQEEAGRTRSDAGGRGGASAADAGRPGLEVGRVESDGPQRPAAERGRREPAADAHRVESERRGVAGVLGGQAAAQPGEGDQRERAGHAARDSREAPADTDGTTRRRDQQGSGPGQIQGAEVAERAAQQPGRLHRGRRTEVAVDLRLRPGRPDVDWGPYEPTIRRWERILGRPAPWPTDLLGRLSPVFTEWLMGLPDGWVTDTPGLTRAAMLRALGNGVVRQQAAHALRVLHERAIDDKAMAA